MVTSKIIKKCTGQRNICRNCKEHSEIDIGDRHIGILNKRHFNERIRSKMYLPLHPTNYFIYEDTPDTVLIHIESNDIVYSKQHDLDVKCRVQRIIDIGLYCWECSVKDCNFHLIRIIRQTNDSEVNITF